MFIVILLFLFSIIIFSVMSSLHYNTFLEDFFHGWLRLFPLIFADFCWEEREKIVSATDGWFVLSGVAIQKFIYIYLYPSKEEPIFFFLITMFLTYLFFYFFCWSWKLDFFLHVRSYTFICYFNLLLVLSGVAIPISLSKM